MTRTFVYIENDYLDNKKAQQLPWAMMSTAYKSAVIYVYHLDDSTLWRSLGFKLPQWFAISLQDSTMK